MGASFSHNKPERIFITVKTYPARSKKYGELVCTAGLRENGDWIRLYPIPFRLLDEYEKYKKYQWVRVSIRKNEKDARPESFRPVSEMCCEDVVSKWDERDVLIKKSRIYTNLSDLIKEAKEGKTSLATFKPTRVLDFVATKQDIDETDADVVERISRSPSFFDSEETLETKKSFRLVKQLPYKFQYSFEDDIGKKAKIMVSDWEVGALFTRYDNHELAKEKVIQKFKGFIETKDLLFFLGTTSRYHNIAPNPFIIIGVYYPPKRKKDSSIKNQPTLF